MSTGAHSIFKFRVKEKDTPLDIQMQSTRRAKNSSQATAGRVTQCMSDHIYVITSKHSHLDTWYVVVQARPKSEHGTLESCCLAHPNLSFCTVGREGEGAFFRGRGGIQI